MMMAFLSVWMGIIWFVGATALIATELNFAALSNLAKLLLALVLIIALLLIMAGPYMLIQIGIYVYLLLFPAALMNGS